MKKQQITCVQSNEAGVLLTKIQEERRCMENSSRQQLHDLTRLRIERNRAARHARCATVRMA